MLPIAESINMRQEVEMALAVFDLILYLVILYSLIWIAGKYDERAIIKWVYILMFCVVVSFIFSLTGMNMYYLGFVGLFSFITIIVILYHAFSIKNYKISGNFKLIALAFIVVVLLKIAIPWIHLTFSVEAFFKYSRAADALLVGSVLFLHIEQLQIKNTSTDPLDRDV